MKPFWAKSKQNLSINKAYLIIYLTLTVGFIVGFGSIWVLKEFSDFNHESESLKSEHIEKQKQILRHKVKEYVNFIEYQKSLSNLRAQKNLINFVHQAHAIASNIYKVNKNQVSNFKIKNQIKEAIRPIRFSQKRGYIFINTISGKGVLYPLNKEKEGQQLLSLKDINKNYVIRNEVNYLRKNDSVFIQYPNNYKIKNKYNAYKKISYLIKFKPFDWYLGSYTYLDNFSNEIKNETLKHFHNVCKNTSENIFVYHKNGTCIFHKNSDLIGKHINEFKNTTDRKFASRIINSNSVNNSKFLKSDSLHNSNLMVCTHLVDEWDWIIGLCIDTNEIDKDIVIAKQNLKKKVSYYIFQIILLVLATIISLYFTIKLLLKRMNQNFISFNNFFKKATSSSNKINIEKLFFTEFKELASTINQMIELRSVKEKELQIAIKKAEESDRLKSSFLANMSHEIRTPMNAIIGFSELLQQENLPNETKQQFYSHIRNSGNSLLNLINDIIDFSKIESGELKISKTYFCLNHLFDELSFIFDEIKSQKEKQHLELNFTKELDNSESTIYTDPLRLKQIITNLIDNAIKFTDNGSISIHYQLIQNHIIISVKDTGIGISKDQLKIIFNQFRQADDSHARKYGGTGLGLSISKKLAFLLDGNLWVESTPQEGSTFFIKIPYLPKKNQISTLQLHAKNQPTNLDFNNKRILLIDHDYKNSEIIEQILKPTGATLQIVQYPDDAINKCKQNAFDIIFLDLETSNNSEILANLKSNVSEVKIIAQTAFDMVSKTDQTLKSEFDGFISNPIDKNELLEVLNKTIN